MHTAVAEVICDSPASAVIIRIRVFADDFAAALAAQGTAVGADSAMSRYVRGTFALADRSGRPIPLRWDRAEHTGDVVLLELQATVNGGLSGARILSALLSERFEDQINIVRASYEGHSSTLLFTRGDPAKALP